MSKEIPQSNLNNEFKKDFKEIDEFNDPFLKDFLKRILAKFGHEKLSDATIVNAIGEVSNELVSIDYDKNISQMLEDMRPDFESYIIKKLKSYNLYHDVETEAQDFVQDAFALFWPKRNLLSVNPDDGSYKKIVYAYIYEILHNLIKNEKEKFSTLIGKPQKDEALSKEGETKFVKRERMRLYEFPSGEVDVSPSHLTDEFVSISEFSAGDDRRNLYEEAKKMYDVTFSPLEFEGELSSKQLKYQRRLYVILQRLQGKSYKDLARELFHPDSRFKSTFGQKYDVSDEQELKKAVNTLTRDMNRFFDSFVEEMREELMIDNESFNRETSRMNFKNLSKDEDVED